MLLLVHVLPDDASWRIHRILTRYYSQHLNVSDYLWPIGYQCWHWQQLESIRLPLNLHRTFTILPLCWSLPLSTQILRILLHWVHTYCDSAGSGPVKVTFYLWYGLIDRYLGCRILKHQNIMKIGYLSDWYTAFADSYLPTLRNKPSLNPCNFICCNLPKSQHYSQSKSCKIL
jgi:hypothetical protein